MYDNPIPLNEQLVQINSVHFELRKHPLLISTEQCPMKDPSQS